MVKLTLLIGSSIVLFSHFKKHAQTKVWWLCAMTNTQKLWWCLFIRLPTQVCTFSKAGHPLGILICGCSLLYKRDLWASKSAGAHSTKSLKISGCKRWCPKNLRVRAPAAPILTHSLWCHCRTYIQLLWLLPLLSLSFTKKDVKLREPVITQFVKI